MSTTPNLEDTWTNRIQALLTKAESTEFPDEAEALMAKAQELMVRHAIDEAMLASAAGSGRDQVVSDVVVVEAPYATAKAALLGSVARANDCRAIMGATGNGAQRCVVVGHESDLANVRALFTALSVHAVRAMLAADVPPHDTPRRFRHAFLLAFSGRIGERLMAASAVARAEAQAAPESGSGVSVVLANRSGEVDQAFRDAFPNVRSTRLSSSSTAGRISGRRAADHAGLGQQKLGGRRPTLPTG